MHYFSSELNLLKKITMGKKDKHRPGQSRNDPIFEVVGGKAGKSKNKPQQVTSKLKDVSVFIG